MICPYFLLYKDVMTCQCNKKQVDCLAIIEKCEYPLDRQVYQSDLEDERRNYERLKSIS